MEISSQENLENEFTNIWRAPKIDFDKNCISTIRKSAESLGYSNCEIVSGAGHDACHLSHIAPTGMIFIPCKGGLSHDEAESTSLDQVAAGADVLFNSVLESASIWFT